MSFDYYQNSSQNTKPWISQKPYYDPEAFTRELDEVAPSLSTTKPRLGSVLNSDRIDYYQQQKNEILALYSGMYSGTKAENLQARYAIDSGMADIFNKPVFEVASHHDDYVKMLFGKKIDNDFNGLQAVKTGWDSAVNMRGIAELQNKLDDYDKKNRRTPEEMASDKTRLKMLTDIANLQSEMRTNGLYSNNTGLKVLYHAGNLTRQALPGMVQMSTNIFAGAIIGFSLAALAGVSVPALGVAGIASGIGKMLAGAGASMLGGTAGAAAGSTLAYAAAGAAIGYGTGLGAQAYDTYKLERGLASLELAQMDGLSFEQRMNIAEWIGKINAVIEVGTPDIVNIKFLPMSSARKKLLKATVNNFTADMAEAATSKIIRAVPKFVLNSALDTISESVEEGLQGMFSKYFIDVVAPNMAADNSKPFSFEDAKQFGEVAAQFFKDFAEAYPSMFASSLVTGGALAGINAVAPKAFDVGTRAEMKIFKNREDLKKTYEANKQIEAREKQEQAIKDMMWLNVKELSNAITKTYTYEEMSDILDVRIWDVESAIEEIKESLEEESQAEADVATKEETKTAKEETKTAGEDVKEKKKDGPKEKPQEVESKKKPTEPVKKEEPNIVSSGNVTVAIDKDKKLEPPTVVVREDGSIEVDDRSAATIQLSDELGNEAIDVEVVNKKDTQKIGWKNENPEDVVALEENVGIRTFVKGETDYDWNNKTFYFEDNEKAREAVTRLANDPENVVLETRETNDGYVVTINEPDPNNPEKVRHAEYTFKAEPKKDFDSKLEDSRAYAVRMAKTAFEEANSAEFLMNKRNLFSPKKINNYSELYGDLLIALSKATGISVNNLATNIIKFEITSDEEAKRMYDAGNSNYIPREDAEYYTADAWITRHKDGTYTFAVTPLASEKTLVHEMGHMLRFLTPKEELTAFEEYYGREFDIGEIETWENTLDEIFAEDFSRYMAEGRAPTTKLQSLFKRIKTFLYSMFESRRLPNEIRKAFDDLFSKHNIEEANTFENEGAIAFTSETELSNFLSAKKGYVCCYVNDKTNGERNLPINYRVTFMTRKQAESAFKDLVRSNRVVGVNITGESYEAQVKIHTTLGDIPSVIPVVLTDADWEQMSDSEKSEILSSLSDEKKQQETKRIKREKASAIEPYLFYNDVNHEDKDFLTAIRELYEAGYYVEEDDIINAYGKNSSERWEANIVYREYLPFAMSKKINGNGGKEYVYSNKDKRKYISDMVNKYSGHTDEKIVREYAEHAWKITLKARSIGEWYDILSRFRENYITADYVTGLSELGKRIGEVRKYKTPDGKYVNLSIKDFDAYDKLNSIAGLNEYLNYALEEGGAMLGSPLAEDIIGSFDFDSSYHEWVNLLALSRTNRLDAEYESYIAHNSIELPEASKEHIKQVNNEDEYFDDIFDNLNAKPERLTGNFDIAKADEERDLSRLREMRKISGNGEKAFRYLVDNGIISGDFFDKNPADKLTEVFQSYMEDLEKSIEKTENAINEALRNLKERAIEREDKLLKEDEKKEWFPLKNTIEKIYGQLNGELDYDGNPFDVNLAKLNTDTPLVSYEEAFLYFKQLIERLSSMHRKGEEYFENWDYADKYAAENVIADIADEYAEAVAGGWFYKNEIDTSHMNDFQKTAFEDFSEVYKDDGTPKKKNADKELKEKEKADKKDNGAELFEELKKANDAITGDNDFALTGFVSLSNNGFFKKFKTQEEVRDYLYELNSRLDEISADDINAWTEAVDDNIIEDEFDDGEEGGEIKKAPEGKTEAWDSTDVNDAIELIADLAVKYDTAILDGLFSKTKEEVNKALSSGNVSYIDDNGNRAYERLDSYKREMYEGYIEYIKNNEEKEASKKAKEEAKKPKEKDFSKFEAAILEQKIDEFAQNGDERAKNALAYRYAMYYAYRGRTKAASVLNMSDKEIASINARIKNELADEKFGSPLVSKEEREKYLTKEEKPATIKQDVEVVEIPVANTDANENNAVMEAQEQHAYAEDEKDFGAKLFKEVENVFRDIIENSFTNSDGDVMLVDTGKGSKFQDQESAGAYFNRLNDRIKNTKEKFPDTYDRWKFTEKEEAIEAIDTIAYYYGLAEHDGLFDKSANEIYSSIDYGEYTYLDENGNIQKEDLDDDRLMLYTHYHSMLERSADTTNENNAVIEAQEQHAEAEDLQAHDAAKTERAPLKLYKKNADGTLVDISGELAERQKKRQEEARAVEQAQIEKNKETLEHADEIIKDAVDAYENVILNKKQFDDYGFAITGGKGKKFKTEISAWGYFNNIKTRLMDDLMQADDGPYFDASKYGYDVDFFEKVYSAIYDAWFHYFIYNEYQLNSWPKQSIEDAVKTGWVNDPRKKRGKAISIHIGNEERKVFQDYLNHAYKDKDSTDTANSKNSGVKNKTTGKAQTTVDAKQDNEKLPERKVILVKKDPKNVEAQKKAKRVVNDVMTNKQAQKEQDSGRASEEKKDFKNTEKRIKEQLTLLNSMLNGVVNKDGSPAISEEIANIYRYAITSGFAETAMDAQRLSQEELAALNEKMKAESNKAGTYMSLRIRPTDSEKGTKIEDINQKAQEKIEDKEYIPKDVDTTVSASSFASRADFLDYISDTIANMGRQVIAKRDMERNIAKNINSALKFNSYSTDASVVGPLMYIAQIVDFDGKQKPANLLNNPITEVNKPLSDEGLEPGTIDVYKRFTVEYAAKRGDSLREVPMPQEFADVLANDPNKYRMVAENIKNGLVFDDWEIEDRQKLVDIARELKDNAKELLNEKKAKREIEQRRLSADMLTSLRGVGEVADEAFYDLMKDKYKFDIYDDDVTFSMLANEYITARDRQDRFYFKERGVDVQGFLELAKENGVVLERGQDGYYDFSLLENAISRDMLIDMLKDKYKDEVMQTIFNNPVKYFADDAQAPYGKKNAFVKELAELNSLMIDYTMKPQSLMKVLDNFTEEHRANGLDYTGPFSKFFLRDVWERRQKEIEMVRQRTEAAKTAFEKIFNVPFEKRYTDAGFNDAVVVPLNEGALKEITLSRCDLIGICVYAQTGDSSVRKALSSSSGNNISKEYIEAVRKNEFTDEQRAEWGNAIPTEKERAWADWLIDELESRTEAIARTKYEVENQLLDIIARYFPKYGSDTISGNMIGSIAKAIKSGEDGIEGAVIEDRMTHERTHAIYRLRLDATATWLSTIETEEHYINFADWAQTANAIMPSKAHSAKAGMNLEHSVGIYAGEGYKRALSDYTKRVIGWDRTYDDMSAFLNKYIGAIGTARIAGSLPSAFRNTLSAIPGLLSGKTSAKGTAKACNELIFNHKNAKEFIYSRDQLMAERTNEIFVGYFRNSDTHSKITETTKAISSELYKLAQIIDQSIADLVWLSAYYTATDRSTADNIVTDRDAAHYASEVVQATQSTGEKTAITKLQSHKNPLVKIAMQFTSDTVNMFNLINFDLRQEAKIDKFNDADVQKRIRTYATFLVPVLTSIGSAFISLGWLPDDDDDDEPFDVSTFMNDTTAEFVQQTFPIPSLGEGLGNSITGNNWKNGEYLTAISDLGTLIRTINQFTEDHVTKDGRNKKDKDKTKLTDVAEETFDFAVSLSEPFSWPAQVTRRIKKSVQEGNLGYFYNTNLGNYLKRDDD